MNKSNPHVIDYLSGIVRWKKFIVTNVLILCFITAVISLIIPRAYRAYSVMLPPIEDNGEMGISSILSNLPLGGLGGLGMGSVAGEAGLPLAIITSRTLLTQTAESFSLTMRYNADNMEETVRTLRERISVTPNEEGTISLAVESRTPYFAGKDRDDEARVLAADMANFIVGQLETVNKRLKTDRAHSTRLFIEQRYMQNLQDLEKAENEFKQFQEKNGAIAMTEQTTATISAATEMKVQIIAREVEINVMKESLGAGHIEILRAQTELKALEEQYDQFIAGKGKDLADPLSGSGGMELFLSLEDIPDLGLAYARLYREVLLQGRIQEFLMPQYEQAKIQEARDTPTIQVLDRAIPPIKRSRPKRMLLVLIAGIIGAFLNLMIVYIMVNLDWMKQTDQVRYQQLNHIWTQLKIKNWWK